MKRPYYKFWTNAAGLFCGHFYINTMWHTPKPRKITRNPCEVGAHTR